MHQPDIELVKTYLLDLQDRICAMIEYTGSKLCDNDVLVIEPIGTGEPFTRMVQEPSVSGQGGGTLFGLAIDSRGKALYFVDDGNNTLNVIH